MIKAQLRGVKKIDSLIAAEKRKQKRAMNTAVKVEGFRRMRQLRDQVRRGEPAGHPYAHPLSRIARRTKTGRLRKNQAPLYRMARFVRYDAQYRGGDIQLQFGFVGGARSRLATSYKALIQKHQAGVDILYGGSRTELGRRLARIGGKLKKKNDPDARYFFLRKTTGRAVDIPSRDIVDTFYKRYRDDMLRNIKNNFRRKQRGERI